MSLKSEEQDPNFDSWEVGGGTVKGVQWISDRNQEDLYTPNRSTVPAASLKPESKPGPLCKRTWTCKQHTLHLVGEKLVAPHWAFLTAPAAAEDAG